MAIFILILGILIYLVLPFVYYSIIKTNRKSITHEKNISRIMIYGFFVFVSNRLILEMLGVKMGEVLSGEFIKFVIIQLSFFTLAFFYAGFIWLKIFKETNV